MNTFLTVVTLYQILPNVHVVHLYMCYSILKLCIDMYVSDKCIPESISQTVAIVTGQIKEVTWGRLKIWKELREIRSVRNEAMDIHTYMYAQVVETPRFYNIQRSRPLYYISSLVVYMQINKILRNSLQINNRNFYL